MKRPDRERIAKLPMWALEYILALEHEAAEHAAALLRASRYVRDDKPGIKFQLEPGGNHFTIPSNEVRVFFGHNNWTPFMDLRMVTANDPYSPPSKRDGEASVYVMTDRGVRVQPSSHNTLHLIPEIIEVKK